MPASSHRLCVRRHLAVGVVTVTILSFELGLLWPDFMATFGGVFGLAFALEGFSFFMEAIFIGIYVYGWSRLSPRTHFLCGLPIVATGSCSPAGSRGEAVREHAHDAMAPVWEANHVWLVFVLVVMWTAYPVAFGSIASTLAVPLFAAALGIVLRGTTYALRAGTARLREQRAVDAVFGVSSMLTPFALGTVVGAIAAGRVPVGNAAGGMWSSWTGALPLTIGVLAVALGAYLAAVYLAADAVRRGSAELERAFRGRALAAGVVAGALAVAGLAVAHADAHALYEGLVSDGLPALIVSARAAVPVGSAD